MSRIITTTAIEKTKAYQNLVPFKKNLKTKVNNRNLIEQAYIHHRNTGQMMPIGTDNINILNELITNNLITK